MAMNRRDRVAVGAAGLFALLMPAALLFPRGVPDSSILAGQFQLCAELTAILFSEEEAELLRRRARAAQAAA